MQGVSALDAHQSPVWQGAVAPENPRPQRGFSVGRAQGNPGAGWFSWGARREGGRATLRAGGGAPVAIAGGHIHPDQLGGMVGNSQGLHPGDRISNRLIEAAVLAIKLAVWFTAAVDKAVAGEHGLTAETLHRPSFWETNLGGSAGRVCSSVNIEISLHGGGEPVIDHPICSTQPHVHRLKPLHPAALALLAMQHGVPVASAPVGPAGGAAAAAAGCPVMAPWGCDQAGSPCRSTPVPWGFTAPVSSVPPAEKPLPLGTFAAGPVVSSSGW